MFKSIASNTFAQLVAKFVGAGLTLLTTTAIIRLSGTATYGELTKSLVLIAVGLTVTDFGFNAVVVRRFGAGSSLRQGFTELLLTRLLFSFLIVATLNLLVQFLPGGYTTETKSIFWLGSLAILFQGVYTSCNAVFQFQENYWRSTLAVVVGTVVGASLTYYFTLTSPTLAHFLFSNTVGYLLMAIVSLSLVKLPISSIQYSIFNILVLFRSSLPLGGTLLMSVLASKIDTVILGVFRSSAEVGQYGLAYRFFDVILVLPVFIMNALYPRLVASSNPQKAILIRQVSRTMFLFGIIVSALSYHLASGIYLIRPGLDLSVTSLRLLSLSLPLFFLSAPLMWYQIARGHERSTFWLYAAGAIFNTTLNLLFIPRFGTPAAALATGATELFILTLLLYHSLKPNKS